MKTFRMIFWSRLLVIVGSVLPVLPSVVPMLPSVVVSEQLDGPFALAACHSVE